MFTFYDSSTKTETERDSDRWIEPEVVSGVSLMIEVAALPGFKHLPPVAIIKNASINEINAQETETIKQIDALAAQRRPNG